MLEAHGFGEKLVFSKLVGMNVTHHGQVLAGGLEVLPERQDIGALPGELLHGGQHFVFLFAKAKHHPGFCGCFRVPFLGTPQQL